MSLLTCRTRAPREAARQGEALYRADRGKNKNTLTGCDTEGENISKGTAQPL